MKYHTDQDQQISQARDLHTQQIETESNELESMLLKAEEMTTSLQQQYQEKKTKEAHLTEVEQGYYQQRNEISLSDDKIKTVEKQRNVLQYLIN